MTLYLAQAGLLDLSLSFVAEVIAFVLMIAILGRYVYPRVIAAAEVRQRQIAEHLAAAESARQEAQQRLEEAEAQLREARGRAAEIIEGGRRIGEQARGEIQERAREEARRLTDSALREIEAERRKAIDSLRGEVADLVVAATGKVVGETLDERRHRRLIDEAISQVASQGANGRGRG